MTVKSIHLYYQTDASHRSEIHHKSCDELTRLVSSFFVAFLLIVDKTNSVNTNE